MWCVQLREIPMTTNKNFLIDIRCPDCNSLEPFIIEVMTLVKFYDDGEALDDKGSDNEWGDNSFIVCCNCEHQGKIKDFSLVKTA